VWVGGWVWQWHMLCEHPGLPWCLMHSQRTCVNLVLMPCCPLPPPPPNTHRWRRYVCWGMTAAVPDTLQVTAAAGQPPAQEEQRVGQGS
jgi:hypothetical protein